MNFPELYCYINKLKIKQISLEKSETDLIRNINTNYDRNIQEDYDKLKNLRDHDSNELRKDVQDTLQSLKHIKTAIVEKNLENIDLEKLKNGMLSFESYTTFIKQRISTELENLVNDELALTIETTNFEMKLSDYNKHDHECNKMSRYSANYTNDYHLQEEVKEFISFLNENGGHNGGWNNEDHLLFLKIFNKIKNKKKLIQSLHTLFPDISKEKLLNHINWYKKYLQLRNKQKIAIEKWRENKSTKKENDSKETKQNTEETKKPKTKENPECMRQKVEKWKAEKQQRIEQDLEIKNEHLNKTKESEKQKQVKNQEIKSEVRKWKSAKEAKQRAELLAKEIISLREKERRMLLANKLIRDFQNQDNVYITKRLNRLKINVKPPEGSRNKDSPRGHYKKGLRNPERVFKATRQWVARTSHEQAEENMFNKHLFLKKIQKLAVPVWRQSVPQN